MIAQIPSIRVLDIDLSIRTLANQQAIDLDDTAKFRNHLCEGWVPLIWSELHWLLPGRLNSSGTVIVEAFKKQQLSRII
jgi:hypothetical protein